MCLSWGHCWDGRLRQKRGPGVPEASVSSGPARPVQASCLQVLVASPPGPATQGARRSLRGQRHKGQLWGKACKSGLNASSPSHLPGVIWSVTFLTSNESLGTGLLQTQTKLPEQKEGQRWPREHVLGVTALQTLPQFCQVHIVTHLRGDQQLSDHCTQCLSGDGTG